MKPVRMGRKPAINFYSRPCGRGDCCRPLTGAAVFYFYSRPCGRGDSRYFEADAEEVTISTHAPAGGATSKRARYSNYRRISTHAPAGGATRCSLRRNRRIHHFYSRPCGRGDSTPTEAARQSFYFYSRPCGRGDSHGGKALPGKRLISTHAPAGGATNRATSRTFCRVGHFYSRPCGRGDGNFPQVRHEVLRQIAER